MPTSTAPTHRRQADRPTASPAGWPTDQLEFVIQEETPFLPTHPRLARPQRRDVRPHLGMTLAEYQNRWLDLVAIGHEETATARTESARLHRQAEAGGPQRRRWRAEADRVDDFIADAMHVLEDWFIGGHRAATCHLRRAAPRRRMVWRDLGRQPGERGLRHHDLAGHH